MATILSFTELKRALDAHDADGVPPAELGRLLAETVDDETQWRHVARFDETHYRRNPLWQGAAYRAFVICWRPGQVSTIHDHTDCGCGMKVLAGTMTEVPFTLDPRGVPIEHPANVHERGSVCVSFDADIHEIRNDGDEDLVTLHVYTPPLQKIGIYERDSAARREFDFAAEADRADACETVD
jgi:cysteine dioxygenase